MVRSVAVVATGQTELRSAWSELQHIDLIADVVEQVLQSSGVSMAEIDFVVDSGSDILDGRSISNCGFLGAAGAHHKEEARIEEDALWGAIYGATKIAAGGAGLSLVIGYSKPSEGSVDAFYATQCEPFVQRPVGFGHRPALGLQARQYLDVHGLDRDVFAQVADHAWSHAERAGVIGESSSSRPSDPSAFVAAPLRASEISRPVDGAVAVLLASEELAGRFTTRPVWIRGMASAMDQHTFALRTPGSLPACATAAKRSFDRAGISSAAEADFVEVSATSAAGELMVLESIGLADAGRGIEAYTGPVTVNSTGGALPADPIMATGLVRLRAAARALSAGDGHAGRAVVHGAGGLAMQNHCVFVLEVEK